MKRINWTVETGESSNFVKVVAIALMALGSLLWFMGPYLYAEHRLTGLIKFAFVIGGYVLFLPGVVALRGRRIKNS